MNRTMVAGMVACAVGLAGAARAEPIAPLELLDAATPFHATFVVQSGDTVYRGRIDHMPGRVRLDYDLKGSPQAMVLRRDTDQAIVLWPAQHLYIGTSLASGIAMIGGLDAARLERVRDGSEVVSGEPCTRWKVSGRDFNGLIWETADGILMKVDGIALARDKRVHAEGSLKGVVRGRVDPARFEVPHGWFGLPLDRITGGSGAKDGD